MADEKPKKYRWLIWVTVLSVLAFLISPFVLFRYQQRAVLERRVQELASEGYPVSADDLEARYVLPEGVENAADVYQQVFLLYVEPNESERELLPIRGDYISQDDQPPYPKEVMDVVRDSLDKNSKYLRLLDEAARMEYCLFDRPRGKWGFENLEYLTPLKKAAMLLTERNLYLAQTGQTDALFESTQTSMGLANSLSQPLLIDYLVMMAIKAMVAAGLEESMNLTCFSETQLFELQQGFYDMLHNDMYTECMINERALFTKYFQVSPSDLISAFYVTPPLQEKIGFWAYCISGMNEKDFVLALDFYDRYIETTRLPLHEQFLKIQAMETEINSYSPWLHFGLGTFSPSCRIGQIHLRVMGNLQCAETALAVERYRLRYNTLPETLDALVPEFMEAVYPDPFDGKPLRYIRHEDDGFTVYCVGEDGIDNGGLNQDAMAKRTSTRSPDEYDWPFKVDR